ncbi:MAG: cytochrome c [Chitinophagaceae bacterium]|nr:cytochrome c [Chitinophagaceae bacterium]
MRTTKILSFGLMALLATGFTSCFRAGGHNTGTVYMPDMAYSRAVETYAYRDSSKFTTDANDAGFKIYYDATPVAGTIKRGGVSVFPLTKDAGSDTANYVASKQVVNPLPALNEAEMAEAKRLYNVNCGICHGEKLDGNGPLYKGGEGPYPIAPKNLVADPVVSKMPEGQMMYSVTYGKNLMGSYAAQLSTRQRWMVIHYVKSMQPGNQLTAPAATAPAADTTKKTK